MSVEVSFKGWLSAVDFAIECVDRQIKNNRAFVRSTDIMLAVDKYLLNPQNLSPLIAIISIYLFDQGLIYSYN